MPFLPDWAPNIHPLIIHFPIVLLFLAVIADLFSLLLKKTYWLRRAGHILYVLGALSAVVTYLSGKQAADSIDIPSSAYTVLSHHADLAFTTMLFFTIYTAIRLLVFRTKWAQKKIVAVIFMLMGLGGYYFVVETATHGAQLVFGHGIGTQAIAKADQQVAVSGFELKSNGSWTWRVSDEASQDFNSNFSLLKGQRNNLTMEKEDSALAIDIIKESSLLFVAGVNISDGEISATVNLDNFDGKLLLVHNVTDRSHYNFFSIEKNKGRLGRQQDSQTEIMEEGEIPTIKGWTGLKAVGSSGHYRGYVNGELIAHGHGDVSAPGRAGILLSGKGKIRFKNIELTVIGDGS